METILWGKDINHILKLRGSYPKSPETSVLISLIINYWVRCKCGNYPQDYPLKSYLNDKNSNQKNAFRENMELLSQNNTETFFASINQLCGFSSIFTQSGTIKTKWRKLAIMNALSKELNIGIVLIERGDDHKLIYTGYLKKFEVIYLVKDSLEFHPGIHNEVYSLINNPQNYDFQKQPFMFDATKMIENHKTDVEKINVIGRIVMDSIQYLSKDISDKIKECLKQAGISQNLDKSFISQFEIKLLEAGKCLNHSKAVFDCDNVHCIDCLRNESKCRCDKTFDREKIMKKVLAMSIKNTTVINNQMFKVNLPPQINPGPTSDVVQTKFGVFTNQGVPITSFHPQINQPPSYAPNPQNFVQQTPDIHSNSYPNYYNQNVPYVNNQGISSSYQQIQYSVIGTCWVCNKNITNFDCAKCSNNHISCIECSKNYILNVCSICESFICMCCGQYLLKFQAKIYNGYFYHENCLIQRLQN